MEKTEKMLYLAIISLFCFTSTVKSFDTDSSDENEWLRIMNQHVTELRESIDSMPSYSQKLYELGLAGSEKYFFNTPESNTDFDRQLYQFIVVFHPDMIDTDGGVCDNDIWDIEVEATLEYLTKENLLDTYEVDFVRSMLEDEKIRLGI